MLVEVVSLTEGFRPFIHVPAPPEEHWVNIKVRIPSDGSRTPMGNYVVFVWRPGSTADRDPDWIGLESSPILLDGSGNGLLPGSPNNGDSSPALDFAADKDVFQVQAASARPITFTVTGQDSFLRIYDSSGNAVATDRGSGAGGASQVTLEADRAQLFYIEVTAFNGTAQGPYTVQVSQPTDDHPDAPIFDPKKGQQIDGTPIMLDASGFGQATGQIETTLVGDRDVFQVMAVQRNQFIVDVLTTDNTLDTFLRVYDSLGNLVAIDDDGGEGRNSRVTFTTFMGEVYQVEVAGYNDNSVGNYRVTVQQANLPEPVRLGTYDDFNDNQIHAEKWTASASGSARVREEGGKMQLLADGANATNDNNVASLQSLSALRENIEFDVTPRLGKDQNFGYVEMASGSAFIRLRFGSDGAGGVRLTVENAGYVELENAGPMAVSESVAAHVAFRNTSDGIGVYVNGDRRARFEGSLRPDSVLRTRAESAQSASRLQLTPYDDFNDNSINTAKWNVSGGVRESSGRLYLYATEGSQARQQNATTQGKPGGHNIHGARWTMSYLDNEADGMDHWSEITNGTDYIRFFYKSTGPWILVQLGGVYGSGEVTKSQTAGAVVEVKEESGDITIRIGGELKYTIRGKQLSPNSYFRAFAQYNGGNPSGYGDKRMTVDDLSFYQIVTTPDDERLAELIVDNVEATYRPRYDWVSSLYDDFQDGQLDHKKWHAAGTVEEQDGVLKLPLFRDHQPVSGFISTAGIPGGMNLRGFSVGANRRSGPITVGAPPP
jgi:hypothetical protein